ncbi:hypothetical protein [Streptomyces megasporus]|uniref:hypothetical protein n=1 Tax=Streptomyces megasporus TaxID=44060 RepID=UPI0004E160C8|nr:hypothetical protein [Streptomyces megasporus]
MTPHQRRLELAERDLAEARALDLAHADPTALTLTVERLRAALHDTIRLARELMETRASEP